MKIATTYTQLLLATNLNTPTGYPVPALQFPPAPTGYFDSVEIFRCVAICRLGYYNIWNIFFCILIDYIPCIMMTKNRKICNFI